MNNIQSRVRKVLREDFPGKSEEWLTEVEQELRALVELIFEHWEDDPSCMHRNVLYLPAPKRNS